MDALTNVDEQVLAPETEPVVLPATPVITGLQAQGDLIIIPWDAVIMRHVDKEHVARAEQIPAGGVVVLTGNNGHDHTLAPVPGVRWYRYRSNDFSSSSWRSPTPTTLGILVVDEGSVGVLGHIEHGDSYIGPGRYVIRRQREQADEIRAVAD